MSNLIPIENWREMVKTPPSSPAYTLDDIKQLAREYADERHCEARLTVQLSLGCFVEWLARREQGKDGER